MNTHWPDIALLGYIGFFGIICATLIIRESRLGWAMCVKNLAYAMAFGYASLSLAEPDVASEDVRRVLRAWVAIAITWAIVELITLRVRRWRERGRCAEDS